MSCPYQAGTDHRWLLEYDSATYAAYINTLQRQHFIAQKKTSGPGQYLHDWFNCPAAALLVEASQQRVSRQKVVVEETASTGIPDGERRRSDEEDYADDMEAARELEERRDAPMGGHPILEDDNDDIMEMIATQAEPVVQNRRGEPEAEDEDEELQEISAVEPPVFRPVLFSEDTNLRSRVQSRLRKNHEEVLEEQPKWALLAKVLKEIEDTIARVSESHAG